MLKELPTSYFSIEEKKADNELKKHKLGVWGRGLTKSLFQYSSEEWDKEYIDLEKDVQLEYRLGERDEIGEDLKDILKFDIEVRESINDRISREVNNLSNIPTSEDGDGEVIF